MNWGIEVLQTSALPLGYVAICTHPIRMRRLLARVEGFEPSNDGVRVHCLTAWLYPNMKKVNGVDDGNRTHECRSHNPVS